MIRVFIVDDHSIFREGIKKIIADTDDIAVSGEAGNGGEALRRLLSDACDVVLLDLALPGMDGFEVMKVLKSRRPGLPVLVLSMYGEEQYAIRAFKMGAFGYLSKESVAADLTSAIRKVAHGGRYVTPTLAERLACDLGKEGGSQPHESLSHREYQIFIMTASGKTAKEISHELMLARTTVSSYRTRILEKMGLKNTAELIRYAAEQGLMQPRHTTTQM